MNIQLILKNTLLYNNDNNSFMFFYFGITVYIKLRCGIVHNYCGINVKKYCTRSLWQTIYIVHRCTQSIFYKTDLIFWNRLPGEKTLIKIVNILCIE